MAQDEQMAIPEAALESPALLFLFYRVEQIFGIRAAGDALAKLNQYIEKHCGCSFTENPGAYESALTSRERIFEAAKAVTVNETYFFRESAHFDFLERHFIPRIAKLGRPARICSAATSTGCEAYSIAMLLDYCGKAAPGGGIEFEIDAFDVCAGAIEAARDGRYGANALRADGSGWKRAMDRYLAPDGDGYAVCREIREKVRFFPHNIMRGLDKLYDLIFFRNALIYFSTRNRLSVLNHLAEALLDGGLLLLGSSETHAARHPLLASRHASGVFYFQKAGGPADPPGETGRPRKESAGAHAAGAAHGSAARAGAAAGAGPRKPPEFPGAALPREAPPKPAAPPAPAGLAVAALLEAGEGRPNALRTLENLRGGKAATPAEAAAAAAYFLGAQDYGPADAALSHLEKNAGGALPLFLRGEYLLLGEKTAEAMGCFERAAEKEKTFWPAFYRIASLAGEGDSAGRARAARRACESIDRGKGLGYECFLGGFSPDYFRRILERKLAGR